MARTIIWSVVLVAAIIIGIVFLVNSPNENAEVITGDAVALGADTQDEQGLKVFRLGGENFKFTMEGQDNPDIVVNQGDRVRIEFTSTSGFHDWVVDEFFAATERVRDGESTFVEFVADEKGTFEYYCSVGEHRAQGMRGNLIVQ